MNHNTCFRLLLYFWH